MDAADAEKRLQNSAYMDASTLDARMLQGAEKKHDAVSYMHVQRDAARFKKRSQICRLIHKNTDSKRAASKNPAFMRL